VVLLIVALGDAAPAPAQAQAQTGDAGRGKAAYMKAACYGCHGTVGQGGPGGRLAPRPIPMAAFTTFVRQGKMSNPRANPNWAGMPPYSAKFVSDAELADIYAYLTSIPDPPAAGTVPLLSSRSSER
jgi:ubiquinol-cytochrome c reductase cytochrome c subunit